jgi:hypothetical protein
MKYLAIGAVVMLAGCGQTQFGSAARDAIAERGAVAYDSGLENAEWFMCQAASVGSVKRRYGVSKEKADAYNAVCSQEATENVVTGTAQ